MADLKLYAEASWTSPWVFHALVALEEKELPYLLEVAPMPLPAATKAELAEHAMIGKVPVLVHGSFWVGESLAISEYLAETFPAPAHPRLFPADLADRARARQVMSALRTSLMGLREDRPTSSVFGQPVETPLSERGRRDADELLALAGRLLDPRTASKSRSRHAGPGPALFGDWCIADADLTLMLMHLVANGDPVPQPIVDYALAQWDRKSVRQYLSYLPTVT